MYGLLIIIFCLIFYSPFKKYFNNHGQHVNITTDRYGETDIFMKNVNMFPLLNGWKLKVAMRVVNTRFAQRFLVPIMVKGTLINEIRNSFCDFKPTFYKRIQILNYKIGYQTFLWEMSFTGLIITNTRT